MGLALALCRYKFLARRGLDLDSALLSSRRLKRITHLA